MTTRSDPFLEALNRCQYEVDTFMHTISKLTPPEENDPSYMDIATIDPTSLVKLVVVGTDNPRYKYEVEEKYCYDSSASCFYSKKSVSFQKAMLVTITDRNDVNHNVMQRWYSTKSFTHLSLIV